MWVSATRLLLSSPVHAPAFFRGSLGAARAARDVEGFVEGALHVSVRGELFTVSAWATPRAMATFRDGPVHAELMPKIVRWAKEGAYSSWDDDAMPSMREVRRRLAEAPSFGRMPVSSTDGWRASLPPLGTPGLTYPIRPPRTAR